MAVKFLEVLRYKVKEARNAGGRVQLAFLLHTTVAYIFLVISINAAKSPEMPLRLLLGRVLLVIEASS